MDSEGLARLLKVFFKIYVQTYDIHTDTPIQCNNSDIFYSQFNVMYDE